jgi:hypothetical protein
MYLGAMLGLAFQAATARRRTGTPPKGVTVILGLMVLAFAVDGLNSYLSLFPGAPTVYQPDNTLRVLTGTGMGIAIAAALFPAFNLSVWRIVHPGPALPGGLPFSGLIALGVLLNLILLTQNPWVLYPMALISAAGVLVLITMVYTMIWLIALRQENRFDRLTELLLPLTGGFGLGMVQIIVLDLGRYLLTGTWDGFHFG